MMIPNILIVEDELLIAEMIKEMLWECDYRVTAIARNYEEAIATLISNSKINLAILDINLDGYQSGIDLGKVIQEKFDASFIYLTSYADPLTIKQAAKTNPSAYLVKPFTKSELFATIELIRSRKPIETDIKLKDGNMNVKLSLSDLHFIKSDNNYLEVYTKQKKYLIRNSLEKFLKKINNENLVRIHRSYAVNIQHVTGINGKYLIVQNQVCPLSRNYKEKVLHRFQNT